MLAIGRALLTNPKLLSWTSRPRGSRRRSSSTWSRRSGSSGEEGLAILLIEQNLGVATSIAERQLVMVAGTIAAETTAAELSTTMPSCSAGSSGVEPLAESA